MRLIDADAQLKEMEQRIKSAIKRSDQMKRETIAKAIILVMTLTTFFTIGLGIAWIATEISANVYDRYDVNRDGDIDVQDCLEIQKRILQ